MEDINFQIKIETNSDSLDLFLTVLKKSQAKRDLKITLLNNQIKEIINALNNINYIENNSIELEILKILHDLGVPSNIKGYKYLIEGIELLYDNQNIYSFTKNIYPIIALKYNTSINNVERNIRNAIDIGWLRANWDLMEEIFGYSIDQDRAKPTNKEYIAAIVDYLKLKK